MWQLGESLDVSYVVSARLIGQLSGPARRACMRMTRQQLFPVRDTRSESNEAGLKVVLKHLEDTFCQKRVSKKGEVLSEFIAGHKAHRRRGERISDWLVRYQECMDALADVGVDMSAMGDINGWFILMRAGLTPERRERVIAALDDEDYNAVQIKAILMRQFGDLHVSEGRSGPARPTSQASSNRFARRSPSFASSSRAPPGRYGRPRSTNMVDEGDEEYEEEEEAYEDEEYDEGAPEVAQVVRSELDGLEEDLAAMDLDDEELQDILGTDGMASFEQAAVTMSDFPEALATVRDTRQRLRGRGRGRSSRGGGGGGRGGDRPATTSGSRRPPSRGGSAKGGSRGGGPARGRRSKSDPNQPCFDCGQAGHWAGD